MWCNFLKKISQRSLARLKYKLFSTLFLKVLVSTVNFRALKFENVYFICKGLKEGSFRMILKKFQCVDYFKWYRILNLGVSILAWKAHTRVFYISFPTIITKLSSGLYTWSNGVIIIFNKQISITRKFLNKLLRFKIRWFSVGEMTVFEIWIKFCAFNTLYELN